MMKSASSWWSAPLLVVTLCALPASAATLRVPQDFPTIQEALGAAASGDTVLVSPGLYVGSLDFHGKDVSLRSTHGPRRTTILGDGPLTPQVLIRIGAGGELEGFTLSNVAQSPAGVWVGGAGTRIANNVFDGLRQRPATFGVAIIAFVADPVIEGNLFRDYICDEQFHSSVVALFNRSAARVVNNVFSDNDCRALLMRGSDFAGLEVINNTFFANREHVSAIAPLAGADFSNNLLAFGGLGVVSLPAAKLQWRHNLVFGNTLDYSGIPDLTGLHGNLSSDPLFVNGRWGNFRLRWGSPARDTGLADTAPQVDVAGTPRPLDGDHDGIPAPDIGAYEARGPGRLRF